MTLTCYSLFFKFSIRSCWFNFYTETVHVHFRFFYVTNNVGWRCRLPVVACRVRRSFLSLFFPPFPFFSAKNIINLGILNALVVFVSLKIAYNCGLNSTKMMSRIQIFAKSKFFSSWRSATLFIELSFASPYPTRDILQIKKLLQIK